MWIMKHMFIGPTEVCPPIWELLSAVDFNFEKRLVHEIINSFLASIKAIN